MTTQTTTTNEIIALPYTALDFAKSRASVEWFHTSPSGTTQYCTGSRVFTIAFGADGCTVVERLADDAVAIGTFRGWFRALGAIHELVDADAVRELRARELRMMHDVFGKMEI